MSESSVEPVVFLYKQVLEREIALIQGGCTNNREAAAVVMTREPGTSRQIAVT